MPPEARARLALEQIRNLTPKINAASDQASKIVREVEAFLQRSGATGPGSGPSVESGDDSWELRFHRYGNEQRIVLHHDRVQRYPDDHEYAGQKVEHEWGRDYGFEWTPVSELPWSDSPRDLRLRTFPLLPQLLEQIAEHTEETASAAETAAETIAQMLPEGGQP